ncbi:hypothetical protein [Paenibacillus sp. NPDC058174]|uniref:hypothetical protein n=1 Tax=Paenibacillus sp. NPDC058174 TaxID=3346366 RepID=UPI0036DB90E2
MDEVVNLIYNFFPKGVPFDDIKYTTSEEHTRLYRKRSGFEGKSKFLAELQRVLPNHAIVDWTNLDEYNCMQFKILTLENQQIMDDDLELIKTLGGSRIELVFYVSVLGNFYYYKYVQTNYEDGEWTFNNPIVLNDAMINMNSRIDLLMSGNAYIKLDHSICKYVVSDIETELLNFGEVTIFNCLFTELETAGTA